MAETHELRLKINAAAARAGAREFVAAINSIKTAIRSLDRDSNGAFTRLKKNLRDASKGGRVKLNIVDRTALRNLESYSRLAAKAIQQTGNTNRSMSALAARMQTLSSSYTTARTQADSYTSSLTRLNQQLARQGALATSAASATGRGVSPARGAPTGAGGGRGGAQQAVADQDRVRAAIEATRSSVERLTTSLMKVGGFQTVNQLGRDFRTFQRTVSDGTKTAAEFSRAQTQMRTSISAASTSLTTLSTKARDAARAEREGAQAARDKERAMLQAAASMRSAEQETARLVNRLRALGDTRGVTELNSAMMRLRSSMQGGTASISQMRTAMSSFSDVTSRLKINITGAEAAQSRAARSAREMARQESTAAAEARRLERDMRSAAGAANAAERSFRKAAGGVRGLENAFSGSFQAASLFRTALGSITLGTFTKSVFQAGDALQQFSITMEVASGSAEAAAGDLAFINAISAKLGTNLNASRDAFAKFAVSSDIAGVSAGTTREIFEAVATSMAVLGRGTEDQRLAFLALEQMMSKGVISAEELRRQLGERLPGAVNLMARAVGVSTSELQDMLKAGELISSEVLPKFAKELNKTFGSQLSRTFNRAGSNLGRLQNEFTKVLEVIANSGFLDVLSEQFRDLTSLMRSPDIRDAAMRIGEGLADAAQAAGEAVQFLVRNIEEVGAVAKNVIAAVLVGAFARMVQSVAIGGQQFLVALNSARALGQQSQVTAASIQKLGASAGMSALEITALQRSMIGAAAAGGRLGSILGAVGRGFGLIGGPLGIALTALTVMPMIFGRIEDSADQTSREYQRALRAMGVANFTFLDTAREVEEATRFEQLQENVNNIIMARKELEALQKSGQLDAGFEDAFKALSNAAGAAAEGGLKTLRTDYEAFRQSITEGSDIDKSREKLDQLNKTIAGLKLNLTNLGAFEELRALDEMLKPGARGFLLLAEATARANDISEEATETLLRQVKASEAVQNEMDFLIGGTHAFDLAQDKMAASTREAIKSIEGMANAHLGLTGVVGDTATALNQFTFRGTRELSDSLQMLMLDFQGTDAEINKLRETLLAAKTASEQAAAAARNSGERERALAAAEAAEAGLALVDALDSVKNSSDDAAASTSKMEAAVNRNSGAMAGAKNIAEEYARALDTVKAAGEAIDTVAKDFDKEIEIDLKIAKATGVDRAILTDLHRGGRTSQALKEVDEQLAKVRSTIATLPSNPFGSGAEEGLKNELRALEQNREAIIAKGEAATRAIFAENEANKQAKKSSAKRDPTALEEFNKAHKEYISGLEEESIAHGLVATGITKSAEAAAMLAEAHVNGANLTREQTMEFIAQAEAAEFLTKKLGELANDPVNDWMNSVATWREAGQQIETQVFESLGDAVSEFIQTGKFSFEELGASILSTAADIISDIAVKEFIALLGGNVSGEGEGGFGLGGIFSDLFANNSIGQPEGDPFAAGFPGGQINPMELQMALSAGGREAAEFIRQAMTMAGSQLQASITGGGAGAGAQINAATTQGGAQAGTAMNQGIVSGGSVAATQMGAAVQTGSSLGGDFLSEGVQTGSQLGGGIFQQLFSGLFGGGGGGGGLGGLFTALLPAFFGDVGGVTSGPGPAIPQVMAPAGMFKGAPKFASGTPNVSGGVPAILHDNEAVVPLTGGRKIPIEGDVGGGGVTIVQEFHITTPDADSFRKSQTQIAADAAAAGQRAMSRNR